MKDVAKFLNQDVNLQPVGDLLNTNVDLNKCAQVAAIVAIFGVIPAFTYGTVLGNLDAQKEVLISEVAALHSQAAVVTAQPVASSTRIVIYNAATDKQTYAIGSTTVVTFYSALEASTTNIIALDLYAGDALVQRLATMSPYKGPNRYSFVVASSTLAKVNVFKVKITSLKYGVSINTNPFQVKNVVVRNEEKPLTISVIGKPSATVIPGYDTVAGGSDIGIYRFRIQVNANMADRYVLTNKMSSGFSMGFSKDSNITATKTHVEVYSAPREGDTEYGYKIAKGTARYFEVILQSIPSVDSVQGYRVNGVNYANTAEGARTLRDASNVQFEGASTDAVKLFASHFFKG